MSRATGGAEADLDGMSSLADPATAGTVVGTPDTGGLQLAKSALSLLVTLAMHTELAGVARHHVRSICIPGLQARPFSTCSCALVPHVHHAWSGCT